MRDSIKLRCHPQLDGDEQMSTGHLHINWFEAPLLYAYYYDEETDCYVCPDCGYSISVEEYRAVCETITVQKFNF